MSNGIIKTPNIKRYLPTMRDSTLLVSHARYQPRYKLLFIKAINDILTVSAICVGMRRRWKKNIVGRAAFTTF